MTNNYYKDSTDYMAFENGGMTVYYHKNALNSPHDMIRVGEELKKFINFFSDPCAEHGVHWGDVHDEPEVDIFNFFSGMNYINYPVYDYADNELQFSNHIITIEQAMGQLPHPKGWGLNREVQRKN